MNHEDEEEPWVEKPPAEYLRDLADRIHHIPMMHGVDSYDYSRLYEIARSLDTSASPPGPWGQTPVEEPDPQSVIVTADSLVEMLRGGKKMKPVRWTDAELFRDGYCHIKRHNPYTFIQYTPHTFSIETSSAQAGAQQAIDQFGDRWIEVPPPEMSETCTQISDAPEPKRGGRRRF